MWRRGWAVQVWSVWGWAFLVTLLIQNPLLVVQGEGGTAGCRSYHSLGVSRLLPYPLLPSLIPTPCVE